MLLIELQLQLIRNIGNPIAKDTNLVKISAVILKVFDNRTDI